MNRRIFAITLLAAIPSLAIAQAQSRPLAPVPQKSPTRTPRPAAQPAPTLTPVVIDSMAEDDYHSRIVDDLNIIVDALDEVANRALGAIKAPAKANTKRWLDDYVAQALTVSNTVTGLFIIDPPIGKAMLHVYVLRYGNAARETVEKFNDAATNTSADLLIKAQSSDSYATGELRKVLGLLRQS